MAGLLAARAHIRVSGAEARSEGPGTGNFPGRINGTLTVTRSSHGLDLGTFWAFHRGAFAHFRAEPPCDPLQSVQTPSILRRVQLFRSSVATHYLYSKAAQGKQTTAEGSGNV